MTIKAIVVRAFGGPEVLRLEDIEDDLERPEVKLYYDGVVRSDGSGRTVLRGTAVARALRRELKVNGVVV